jgi:UbiA prenyltransferase family protein
MRPFRTLSTVLEMIKIEHTLVRLPFAFLGMLLAAGGWPSGRTVFWIVVAMVGARSAAMAFNRLADHQIDAANPAPPDAPCRRADDPERGRPVYRDQHRPCWCSPPGSSIRWCSTSPRPSALSFLCPEALLRLNLVYNPTHQ